MHRLEATGVNAPQIEYWNGPAGDKWARLADAQDHMLGALGSTAMNVCDIHPGHSVLDVGCGSGTTTIEIARRVGKTGHVLGIDISTPMLDVGRARRNALDIDNVTFENKDVSTYPFEADTFNRVFSRFGVMFFADPINAFSNIRSGLQAGGRIAFVCWQAKDKNPWIEIPMKVVLQHVPAPPPADPEAPGPMAFADPERVRHILSGAGFAEIKIEPFETLIPFEADVSGSVQRMVQIGPASRLLSSASEDVIVRVKSDLSDAIARFQTDNGVMIDGATWIVSAISP
jgi:SAM-dependent methyltransferase